MQLYEGGHEEAPSYREPRPYEPGDRIARRTYAGLTAPELRAAYELTDDESARDAARAKMDALVARESEAYLRAMQLEI